MLLLKNKSCKILKRVLGFVLIPALLIVPASGVAFLDTGTASAASSGLPLSDDTGMADILGSSLTPSLENVSTGRLMHYTDYLDKYSNAKYPSNSVDIDIFGYKDSKSTEVYDVEGHSSVVTDEDGYVEWDVNIPETGLYNINMEYYPLESRSVDIERRLFINGEIPYSGADALKFSRVWTDSGPVRQDNRGNDIRSAQAEAPRWLNVYFKDALGYFSDPYMFYFEAGVNTIRLESINEPLAIRKLVVSGITDLPLYADVINNTDKSAYSKTPDNYMQIIQGEDAPYRSSPTLYAVYDRSSPDTVPYSVDKIKFNMMGGINWNIAGQWIEWEIDVPEDGLYYLTFKYRQNYNRGNVSIRQLTIDGEVPFAEVAEIAFQFNNDWDMMTLGDENGEPYLFPLTKGRHTICLEAALGEMGGFMQEIEQCVNRLTRVYRQLLVVIGTTPDPNRDYQIHLLFPEVMAYFEEEMAFLNDLTERVTAYSGQRGEQIAAAQTLSKQFERFLRDPDLIPRSLGNFRINIGSLATFLIRMSDTPLDIDFIVLSSPDVKLPKPNTGFWARLVHEIRSFVVSFFVDYSSIGDSFDDSAEPLEVWILTGRDQSQILKNIIDDTFTPQYGISVNLRLVAPNVLLPAVVAGTGPDVALQVPNSEPVNFALRNSVVDLSVFEDFDEVKSMFYDSVFTPLSFGGAVYALPEIQGFQVMFYREDILSELGLEIPQTWGDVIKLLPVLHNNNLDFGLAPDDLLSIYIAFLTQLYQRNGRIYTEDGKYVLPDDHESIAAFEFLTQMYSHYQLPGIYNFPDRFRTGEMPLGIADYTVFNTLVVSAPEIRGLWNFTLIPGVMGDDGVINRATTGGGPCSMMFPTAEDKDAAWQFMKWWVSTDTQVRFGREMEALMGAAARYATANKEAFEQLGWSSVQRAVIREQWQWVVGTPEVPGGYYTSRHILNAFRKVKNTGEDARETLLDYARTINDELTKKRKEFGLD